MGGGHFETERQTNNDGQFAGRSLYSLLPSISKLLYSWLFIDLSEYHYTAQISKLSNFKNGFITPHHKSHKLILSVMRLLTLGLLSWTYEWYMNAWPMRGKARLESYLHTKARRSFLRLWLSLHPELKPLFSIGGFEWVVINHLESAAFSFQTSENNHKPP